MITTVRVAQNMLAGTLLCCMLSWQGWGATLIHYGDNPGPYVGGPGLAVTWQQALYAQNVTISAILGAYMQTTSSLPVTAYLTTALGPGTTTRDLISVSTSLIASYPGSPASYTLFSGLNLLPGTYYLSISHPYSSPIGWLSSSTPSLSETAGFSYMGALTTNGTIGPVDLAYMPASEFFPLSNSSSPASYGLIFDISGETGAFLAPEPGGVELTTGGIAVLVFCGFRRSKWRVPAV